MHRMDYDPFSHFWISVFGIHNPKMVLLNIMATLTGILVSMFHDSLADYQYQVVAITFLALADWITGLAVAFKTRRFETRKAVKIVYELALYWIVIVSVFVSEKAFPELFWLDKAILLPIIFIELTSILKNTQNVLGLSKGWLVGFLKYVDRYKTPE